ncbi:helix-turn-helix domain-containing protein [Rhodococcus ruber]|uniref:helix-turn-helix domain-containing protein n=1 Tax=Rhodococcus ruber TaxID=1830 RepID=UPI0037851F51
MTATMDWTDEESTALDVAILALEYDRPPLSRDPHLWNVLTEDRNNHPINRCAGTCGRGLVGQGQPVPDGYRTVHAIGMCKLCYNNHRRKNPVGIDMRRAKKTAPPNETQSAAIRLTRDGLSAAEISERLGVSERTICRWLARYARGDAA